MLGLLVGTRFGVVGLRQAGGHAAVYDAWDAAQAEPCVLKIVRSERHALGNVHDRLLHEARLMRAAPAAPRERGVGRHETEPCFAFLAMDAAAGARITESEAPVDDRAQAAATALSALHGAGVFHGDLKPAHIWFAEGRVTLLDFGSACFADAPEDAHRSTTPAYAAPEREASGPSAASDVYSLGCVLFEMASGERPFAGLAGAPLAEAHAKQPISCDRLPRALGRAVSWALAKRAAERPSAVELLSAVTS